MHFNRNLRLLVLSLVSLLLISPEEVNGQGLMKEGNGRRPLATRDLPECVRTCLLQRVEAHCELADIKCQCQSADLIRELADCVAVNCSTQEGLDAARVHASQCDLGHPDQSKPGAILLATSFGTAFLAVSLRLLGRQLRGGFYADDFFITCAALFAIPILVSLSIDYAIGLGRHLYDIANGAIIETILGNLFISYICYIISLTFTKVSIPCFYLRIFRGHRAFSVVTLTVMASAILSGIINLVLGLLSCRPIEVFWDRDIRGGICLDTAALWTITTVVSIAEEVTILLLPLFMLAALPGLPMPVHKKMCILAVFTIGALAVFASIARLVTLPGFDAAIEPSWDFRLIAYWTAVELSAAIVAACMPGVRTLFREVAKRAGLSWGSDEGRGGESLNAVVTRFKPVDRYHSIEREHEHEHVIAKPAATYSHPAFGDAWEEADAVVESGAVVVEVVEQQQPPMMMKKVEAHDHSLPIIQKPHDVRYYHLPRFQVQRQAQPHVPREGVRAL